MELVVLVLVLEVFLGVVPVVMQELGCEYHLESVPGVQ